MWLSEHAQATLIGLLGCLDCGAQYNVDWNSAMNISSVFFFLCTSPI